jgi:2-oxoglutarate dehydrogenase E1 component
MEASLAVPTATSVRTVEVSALEQIRTALNARPGASKSTFGHVITYAIVTAFASSRMLRTFHSNHLMEHEHVNVGVAVDMDGSLVVPVIHKADTMSFDEFRAAYDALVQKASSKTLTVAEMTGATVSVTNPGGLGTTLSVPRLMTQQAAIIGVGAISLPYGFRSADPSALEALGVSRVCTLTSTYDHRVIQGADSGRFLAHLDELLQGAHGFAAALGLPLDWTPRKLSTTATAGSAATQSATSAPTPMVAAPAELSTARITQAWRERGHLAAQLNPLVPTSMPAELTLEHLGALSQADINEWERCRNIYGGTAALQAEHLAPSERDWLHGHFENRALTASDIEEGSKLTTRAEAFEQFLAKKYVGQKRFGLEGLESMVALLDRLVDGTPRVFIGMPHRGRLNVLCHITHKPYEKILSGFEGHAADAAFGAGDVKYHLGYTGNHHDALVTVAENPSHLEVVAPIVCGMARAHRDETGQDALAVVIHGDASATGQGVVWETLALSGLDAYDNRGVIHLIADNQVGFTTDPHSSRAQAHPSDSMRGFDVPVLHANADDIEAVLHIANVAVSWRRTFGRDCVIRLSGYRRNGHNEGDDASYTQPLNHSTIQKHPSIGSILATAGLPSDAANTTAELQAALDAVRGKGGELVIAPAGLVEQTHSAPSVTETELDTVRAALEHTPTSFAMHPKLAKLLEARKTMLDTRVVDWAAAELYAFGVIALRGTPLRLVGEDARRGTFSHRHASYVDTITGEHHLPLQAVGEVQVWNSLLSEYAALGFEYGYQLQRPDALVMWEGQFGDFANVAQVVIDQYIAAGEDKWGHHAGLTLMLPHGFEGQGPEHSSARLERFLQLAANGSMRVCYPTTSAQWFHLLLDQTTAAPRRPLIVMSPKQPLRMAQTRSSIDELLTGGWNPVLDDPTPPQHAQRVVLCSGKVAWDLIQRRDEKSSPTRIVRVEQLHPLPDELLDLIGSLDGSQELVWVQEEPLNQGAWRYIQGELADRGIHVRGIGRAPRSSPATGLKPVHDRELEILLDAAIL